MPTPTLSSDQGKESVQPVPAREGVEVKGRFPSDFRLSAPTIRFSCRDGDEAVVTLELPIPKSVIVNDGADYGTIDLGLDVAGPGGGGAQDFYNDPSLGNTLMGGAKIAGTAILKTALAGVGSEETKEKVLFASRSVIPKNTNTTFTGNTMRTFDFSFDLIARTLSDVNMARTIQSTFRRYIYAGATKGREKLIQSYPPVWKIEFFVGGETKESPYYPKIFGCYLKSANCTIGALSNATMSNGAPIDITIALSFQETRVLNRADIDALEFGNRGISSSGTSTV